MNAAQVSSVAQFVAKGVVLATAAGLAIEGRLTDGIAAVLSAALFSLGLTNAGTLIAAAKSVGAAFAPIALPPGATATISMAPPPIPAAVTTARAVPPLVVLLLALGVLRLSTACAGAAPDAETPTDHASTASEAAEQLACVDEHKPDTTAIDACRAGVRARWSGYWSHELDGGGNGQ